MSPAYTLAAAKVIRPVPVLARLALALAVPLAPFLAHAPYPRAPARFAAPSLSLSPFRLCVT